MTVAKMLIAVFTRRCSKKRTATAHGTRSGMNKTQLCGIEVELTKFAIVVHFAT